MIEATDSSHRAEPLRLGELGQQLRVDAVRAVAPARALIAATPEHVGRAG